MVLLSDALYKQTRKLASGRGKKSPILTELSDWLMEKYSVRLLNFAFSQLESSASSRYRLYLILENSEDYQKMYVRHLEPKKDYQKQIAGEFRKLALKHHIATEEQLEDLFVTYNDFSEEAKTVANWKAIDSFKWVVRFKYRAVWRVISIFSSTVVFYHTDSEIALNEQYGLSARIVDDYYTILKKFDRLNYYTRENIQVKFDSKENVDKNYEGSLFYYTR
ncbi:MAG: hypothetical protein P8046_07425 [Anaerolineales bacterium]